MDLNALDNFRKFKWLAHRGPRDQANISRPSPSQTLLSGSYRPCPTAPACSSQAATPSRPAPQQASKGHD